MLKIEVEQLGDQQQVSSATEADDIAAASPDTIRLPEKQAKRHESYAPEIMEHYRRKFGLSAGDISERKWWALVQSKIDSDIHIVAQNKELFALKTRCAAMLALIGKLSKKPKAKAANAAG